MTKISKPSEKTDVGATLDMDAASVSASWHGPRNRRLFDKNIGDLTGLVSGPHSSS